MGLFSKKKPKVVKTTSTSKNKSFYLRENHIITPNDFNKIFDLVPEEGAVTQNVSTEISFSGIPFSEITPERIIEELDNPSFVLDNTEDTPGHVVYFYRQKAELIDFLIQLHFINDKCIYINNKISASGITMTNEDKKKVIDRLFLKYNINKKTENNNLIIFLTDPYGNKLYTTDTVHFYLNYVINNKELEKLKKIFDTFKPEDEAEDEFDEALGKFI